MLEKNLRMFVEMNFRFRFGSIVGEYRGWFCNFVFCDRLVSRSAVMVTIDLLRRAIEVSC